MRWPEQSSWMRKFAVHTLAMSTKLYKNVSALLNLGFNFQNTFPIKCINYFNVLKKCDHAMDPMIWYDLHFWRLIPSTSFVLSWRAVPTDRWFCAKNDSKSPSIQQNGCSMINYRCHDGDIYSTGQFWFRICKLARKLKNYWWFKTKWNEIITYNI